MTLFEKKGTFCSRDFLGVVQVGLCRSSCIGWESFIYVTSNSYC